VPGAGGAQGAVQLDADALDVGQQAVGGQMPRIGPTVCEPDGPMPIEKRSKTETAVAIHRSKLRFGSDVDAGRPRLARDRGLALR
jgi:hypothetical protein